MKSFFPTLVNIGRQKVRCFPHTFVRSMGRSAEVQAEALAKVTLPARSSVLAETTDPTKATTFEDLGLHPPIVASLRAAFPNVKNPTETQAQFIPAILSGQDVLLKDETGSGKSFGLVVALLNKPRVSPQGKSKKSVVRHITSLVLVPHRDLAYQLLHWIERMTSVTENSPLVSTIAQVLVRDGGSHLSEGLPLLRQTPPHILIGTPQAIMDVYKEDPEALQLRQLSSVVVDEVDYLIETVPNKDPQRSYHKATLKAKRKLLAHPGVTRQLLDIIYSERKKTNAIRKDEPGIVQEMRRRELHRYPIEEPQLIFSSATLRRHLNNYLFEESGWLNRDNLLKVRGNKKTPVETKKGFEGYLHDGLGGTGISHSVLLVSEDGIKNIAGSKPPPTNPAETEHLHTIDPQTLFATTAESEPVATDPSIVDSEWQGANFRQKINVLFKTEYKGTPTPFNPNAMEAVATAFALDVPSVALLVLPSSSPVQRAVYELREMGVNAHGLDLLTGEKGRSHLLSGDGNGQDNPTLLVSTLATTRGLDLPELTHVFIMGIPDGPKVNGRTIDGYVHLAGRVGRFGRGGKVITVVEKEEDMNEGEAGARRSAVSEGSKMLRILATVNETPTALVHFD